MQDFKESEKPAHNLSSLFHDSSLVSRLSHLYSLPRWERPLPFVIFTVPKSYVTSPPDTFPLKKPKAAITAPYTLLLGWFLSCSDYGSYQCSSGISFQSRLRLPSCTLNRAAPSICIDIRVHLKVPASDCELFHI